MNKTLANAADSAVPNPDFVREKGKCSKFTRQVAESVYGLKYRHLFGASALISAGLFAQHGFTVPRSESLELGDLLFKGTRSGEYGHVGILTEKGVAENSSTRIGRVDGAKGYRSLEQYGRYDWIGRLPAPAWETDSSQVKPRLIIAEPHNSGYIYTAVETASYEQHRFWANCRELASIVGVPNRWKPADRMPARVFFDSITKGIEKEGNHLDDAEDPRYYLFLR